MKLSKAIEASIPEEVREETVKRIAANSDLFTVFANIFEKRLKDAHKNSISMGKYDLVNWPYYQADHVGYTRAMDDVIKLLRLEE